jgi:hypothetical protein
MYFLLSHNQFTGSVPCNISAYDAYDVSFNQLSGSLGNFVAAASSLGAQSVIDLQLAGNVGLDCPLQLAEFTSLAILDLHGTGLAACDLSSADALPLGSLVQLDISDVLTTPRTITFAGNMPRLMTLTARNASISFLSLRGAVQLRSLQLDDNPVGPSPWIYQISAPDLELFSAKRCNLSFPLDVFVGATLGYSFLQILNLDENALVGTVPSLSPGILHGSAWPSSLQALTVSRNVGITGPLPEAGEGNQITTLDLSGTSVGGNIPASWSSLTELQQLSLKGTEVRCQLQLTVKGDLNCPLPGLLHVGSSTVQLLSPGSGSVVDGVQCKLLELAGNGLGSVYIDPSYSGLSVCTCDSNHFGANGMCIACPESCTCKGSVVTNCWPVIVPGLVSGSEISDGSMRVSSVVPFSVVQLLPCADSVCNSAELPWTRFYLVNGSVADGSSLVPADFCAAGYTSRLCSQCSEGWFSAGRFCSRCLSDSVHVLIVIINMALLLALVVYLWKQLPSETKARESLRTYLSSVQSDKPHEQPVGSDPVLASASSEVALTPSVSGSSSSPLRLLIFHSQQLSLLLLTSASLPSAMNVLLAVFSSGSQGFSLASLTAIECLNYGWSLQHRCWAAVIAAMLIALAAAGAFVRQWMEQMKERRTRIGLEEFAIPAASSSGSKVHSVCLSLCYLLLFPCAATALSALACTDTREVDHRSDSLSRVYLNLNPWIQCDQQWQTDVLPPALLAAMIWCVMFPLLSTFILRSTHMRLMSERDSNEPSDSSLRSWSVVSDMLKPYSARLWFFEQALLIRRLLLVACVSFVSSSSIYLPLLLLALIQIASIIQHTSQPYISKWMNRGELASLWLLQLNYIAAVISSSSNEGQGSGSGWFVLLFIANICFLLMLVAFLFSWLRVRIEPFLRAQLHGSLLERCVTRNRDKESTSIKLHARSEGAHLTAHLSDPLLD